MNAPEPGRAAQSVEGGRVPGWRGAWIEPVPVPELSRRPQRLRRTVVLQHPAVSARVRIASRGDAALFVNDVRLDGEGPSLGPGGEPVARDYDAAPHLRAGENIVAVILGESWGIATPEPGVRPFAGATPPLAVLLDLEIVDARGATITLGSDDVFRATTGAIIYSEPGRGERQHHALRDPGWKLPGFDDAEWTAARLSADQGAPPADTADTSGTSDTSGATGRAAPTSVRVVGEVPAVSITGSGDGTALVDFGRRLVGRVRVGFSAPAGTEVTVEHWPHLPPASPGDPILVGTDVFVSAGDAEEVFEPGYAFHDFRFVRVTGLPEPARARFTVLELSIPPAERIAT